MFYYHLLLGRALYHTSRTRSTNLSLASRSRTTVFSGISNPFVMKAIASSCMAAARKERPADRNSLNRLQRDVDKFTLEVGRCFLALSLIHI